VTTTATAVPPGTRVSIVDDEPELLDMLTAYFLISKYDIDTATKASTRSRPWGHGQHAAADHG
jgi:DNA-binding response OmpR family regulator